MASVLSGSLTDRRGVERIKTASTLSISRSVDGERWKKHKHGGFQFLTATEEEKREKIEKKLKIANEERENQRWMLSLTVGPMR